MTGPRRALPTFVDVEASGDGRSPSSRRRGGQGGGARRYPGSTVWCMCGQPFAPWPGKGEQKGNNFVFTVFYHNKHTDDLGNNIRPQCHGCQIVESFGCDEAEMEALMAACVQQQLESKLRLVWAVAGHEQCPDTGRWHLQGAVSVETKIKLRTFKNALFHDTHCETMRASTLDNEKYTFKDGDVRVQFGERPLSPAEKQQTKVRQICEIVSDPTLVSGDAAFAAVIEEFPEKVLSCRNIKDAWAALRAVREDAQGLSFLDDHKNLWVCGPTGVGKSGWLRHNLIDPASFNSLVYYANIIDTQIVFRNDYAGQPIVWIDEVTAEQVKKATDSIKRFADLYPCQVRVFHRGPVGVRPQHVVFTSQESCDHVLGGLSSANFAAVMRRFQTVDLWRCDRSRPFCCPSHESAAYSRRSSAHEHAMTKLMRPIARDWACLADKLVPECFN